MKVINAFGKANRTKYDKVVIAATDPLEQTTEYQYDGRDRKRSCSGCFALSVSVGAAAPKGLIVISRTTVCCFFVPILLLGI